MEGLRHIAAVHRCGSFSGAAREFGVAQPALSAAVRKVEDFMGHPLFERSTQGVVPTPFGATVIGLIEDAVAADEACARTLVLVAPTRGLTVFTEALFRSAGVPLHEHPGRAASYRVLEEGQNEHRVRVDR
ncbi:transcriptional regulator, LysR family [Schaalia georgiae F0490]|uniref:Transcriptional regulator, LysR family n=1 Tax=Schaalia georgiae F0490 TaxID=1125717 RepID=J0MLZ4_9ACTO|nr:transcriptional regulator, LysR family [Schaalia georgiae F0490]